MSYAFRNSIILAVLVFIVNGIGWFTFIIPARKEIKVIQEKIRALDQKIATDATLPQEIGSLKELVNDFEKRWLTRRKILPVEENSRLTYSFINQLVDRVDEPFPFDFDFNSRKDTLGVSTCRYTFRADVPYSSISEFIHNVEKHKRLIIVPDFQIDLKPPVEGESIFNYKATVNAKFVTYSSINGSSEIPNEIPNFETPSWNPFRPLVVEKVPKNEEGLLEVDGAKLIAVIKNKAYIQDQNNQLLSLEEGDPVYLGYVTSIDPVLAKVTCTLNYGGFIRKRELDLIRDQSFLPGIKRR